jgi:2-keto-4-pentenoate hydratase/2-oxohepta-3-ene-1,7-dioic acid hydratase in catechol pathway
MRFVRLQQASANPQIALMDSAGEWVLLLGPQLAPTDDLVDLIAAGPARLHAIEKFRRNCGPQEWRLASEFELAAPMRSRRSIFCVGKNYRAHAEEFHRSGFDASAGQGSAIPDAPIIFTKAPSSIIGPNAAIPAYLDETGTTDYEGELAVVIGKAGRAIRRADAFGHVFGYTILNDVTARSIQQHHKQWFLGKSIDGYCPLGPAVVTKDEIADLSRLELRKIVDGEVRQRAAIRDLIFDVPSLIETISKRITLECGDIIATGTPDGVGIGFSPPKFLGPGSVVRVEIDSLGSLENRVVCL